MVVISYSKLRDFYVVHAGAKDALNNWFRLVSEADWSNFHEMKEMFAKGQTVFSDFAAALPPEDITWG